MKKVIALLYVAFAVGVAFPQMASATITGSFTAAPPAYFVPSGGTAFFGQPVAAPGFPGGGLATSITTTPVPTGPGEIPLPPPPSGAPEVEVLFLTDTTGSMGSVGNGALAAFQSAVAFGGGVMTSYETANPGTSFSWAVADYHDFIGTDFYAPVPYVVGSAFGTAASAEAAIAAYGDPFITVGGGLPGQEPEQQFSSLVELAEGWETVLGGSPQGDAERIIIWTGDSAANEGVIDYDPPGPAGNFTYPVLFNVTAALRDQGISVWGMNVGPATGGIDIAGGLGLNQASEIVEATGGMLTNSVGALAASTFGGEISGALDTAIDVMNNIVVRVDPTTLGAWSVNYFERNTNYPLDPMYPFNFTYAPTLAPVYPPFGTDPTKPWGFPTTWGSLGVPPSFLDNWGLEITAPAFPDSQLATFELRVDGVLITTTDILLTNEPVPEPSTFALGILSLMSLGFIGYRRRRR